MNELDNSILIINNNYPESYNNKCQCHNIPQKSPIKFSNNYT